MVHGSWQLSIDYEFISRREFAEGLMVWSLGAID
jgi:hypothetical protein